MTRSRFATTALLAASSALAVLPAAGQQYVQDGNAHDANHQVGSGGANRVENQVDYSQRNLLITGQVGGGRAFQDEVGYFTAGGFQDALGSDSLFNFQRDSIYSSPQALGVQVRNVGSQVVVTRNTTQVPGLQVASPLGTATRTVFDTNSGTLSFRRDDGGLIIVPGLRDLQDAPNLYSIGTVRTQDGALAQVNASPLTGIQINPLQADPFRFNTAPQTDTQFDPTQQTEPGTPGLYEPVRPWDNLTDPAGPNVDTENNPAAMRSNNGRAAPSMVLGNQINAQLSMQTQQTDPRNLDGSLTQLNNYLFGSAQPNVDPALPPQAPQNPYEAILAQIREQAQLAEPADPEAGTDPGIDKPEWMSVLENPDEAVLDAINRAKEDAIRRSLGLVDENGEVNRDVELPDIDRNSELGQMIENLNYDLPRVATLSGEDRQVRHNKMLLRAEQDLAAGSYLSAENIYRQVLRESQDNPLAKAGLIHAQLGGGMIRSAAFNLRALFSEHPELIALRYDENLLPSAERLRWLQRELQEMISQDIHGAEPGLILAYLGHQLEAEPLVQYGLGVAQERSPRDPLLPVLDRIWLDHESE